MTQPATTWLELNFDRVGGDIRISARGSRNEQPAPQSLSIDPDQLLRFALDVERAARYGQPLAGPVLDAAHALQQAVLSGPMATLFAKLGEAAYGGLLLRLMVRDPDLQGVPWEALCNPGEALGFWGTSPKVLPVRGVASNDAWLPREVRGAIKILAIAPTDDAGLANLQQSLAERIRTGEVEWLEPIVGAAAKVEYLPQQLRLRSPPHVIHFVGHGSIINGMPALRFADDGDEPKWLPVEVVAQHLQTGFFGTLRLVVLEACEGAKPTGFSSAAETIVKAGADAVVAHLWPVRAEVARTYSTTFYRTLTAADSAGDVAIAVNTARRAIVAHYDTSAEAMSAVLYLRGPEGKIFDFDHRKVLPPRPTIKMPEGEPEVSPALARIARAQFSLVLGDRWKDDNQLLDAFRNKLRGELKNVAHLLPDGLPIGTLAQWFALHRGGEMLEQEFQDIFDLDLEGPSVIAAIARVLCPGVHTTLLRNPWLEHSVAEEHPQRTIYVIQPSDTMALIMKREAGGKKWERLRAAPDSFDEKRDILLLRPCRGYTSNKKFSRPLLTEDDYFLGLRDLWSGSAMPPQLAEVLGGTLYRFPALLVGLSMYTANHRMLLHTLYSRGLPPGSIAVLDQDDLERELWEKGQGLPGTDKGVEVVETSSPKLCVALTALAKENGR